MIKDKLTYDELQGERDFYEGYLELDSEGINTLHYIRDGMLDDVIGDNVTAVIHKELIFEDSGYMEFMKAMTLNKPLDVEISTRIGLAFHTRLLRLEGLQAEEVAGIAFGTAEMVYMRGGR